MPPVPGTDEEGGEGFQNYEVHEDRQHGSVLQFSF